MPELFDVIETQRACRSFTSREVPDDVVERVLTAATHAPSAENRQPWEFVVVRDPSTRAHIGEITRQAWRGGGRDYSVGRISASMFTDVDKGAEGGIAAAPVLVVVCGNTERGNEAAMAASIFPATQNLLLAAQSLGLGSALTTLPATDGIELAAAVGLPAHVHPFAVVPLGWPARPLGPPRREPAAAHTHRDRWGQPW